MTDNFISPLSDGCFKYLFITNEYFRNTLLFNILKDKIDLTLKDFKNGEIQNVELLKRNSTEKRKTADIIFKVNNIFINVEINREYHPWLIKRNIAYLQKISIDNSLSGQEYSDTKFIQINFNDFSLSNNDINYFEYYDKINFIELNNDSLVVHINLAYIRKKTYNLSTLNEFDMLLRFLTARTKEDIEKITSNQMKGVIKDYMEYSSEGIGIYDIAQEQRMILNSARHYYRKEGVNEANENNAKEMLKRNLSIDLISDITKLSKKEILKLKEKMGL